MNYFDAPDGTRLAYHIDGDGAPLVCLPGGPMQASAHLGDLGGLNAYRQLVRLDLRGTGASAVPADVSTYRCDRQVDDVEALRVHLGRERIDLLASSAGAALAVLYAIRHPDRVGQIVLAAPSPPAVGLRVSQEDRRAVAAHRRGEPWFADAYAAMERIMAGTSTPADIAAIAPFHYGRWDAASQAFDARRAYERNTEAADRYYADGVIDPVAIREALAHVDASVLLIAGEYDIGLPPSTAAEFASLFPKGRLIVQPRGGHWAWLDDPDWFVRTVTEFLL
ncbi:MAG: alpha/beta hydrolase [Micromonosporaceae bacterium]|nr:alpha/beta hydrolase [Micromonosporaceae bacterium]